MTFLTKSIQKGDPVGMAGCGTMGKCMLKLLRDEGYTVYVYDPYPAAAEYALEHGGILVDNPEELVANANVIIMSLPKPQQVFDVVGGDHGLRNSISQNHVIVDTSTVSPQTTQTAAELLKDTGAFYVDAPILGRPSAAGNWMMPAGGDTVAIEYVRPVLETFARNIVHVGGQGMGNAFKLLNQLMFSVINGVSAEVMALAEALGLDKKIFYDVISNSGAATVSGLFRETAGRMVDDHYDDPTFTIELLCKDAGLGIEMTKAVGITPLIAGFVQNLNENAKGKGLAAKDTSSLSTVFRQFYSKIGG